MVYVLLSPESSMTRRPARPMSDDGIKLLKLMDVIGQHHRSRMTREDFVERYSELRRKLMNDGDVRAQRANGLALTHLSSRLRKTFRVEFRELCMLTLGVRDFIDGAIWEKSTVESLAALVETTLSVRARLRSKPSEAGLFRFVSGGLACASNNNVQAAIVGAATKVTFEIAPKASGHCLLLADRMVANNTVGLTHGSGDLFTFEATAQLLLREQDRLNLDACFIQEGSLPEFRSLLYRGSLSEQERLQLVSSNAVRLGRITISRHDDITAILGQTAFAERMAVAE